MTQYDFDSYTLYVYTDLIKYTVRIRVELGREIDGEILEKAANKVFPRFPYFARKVTRDSRGGYVMEPNDRPVKVCPETDKAPVLGNDESNGHLYSITYEGKYIYFNFSHSPSGACGAIFWIKATLWQYLTDLTGDEISSAGIKLPGTPFEDGETDEPDPDKLTRDEPIGTYHRGSGQIPIFDYLSFFANPFAKDQYYVPLEIDAKKLMSYAKHNDGSPNSVLAALMFKATGRLWASKPFFKQITAGIVANYRADVGCPHTYRDFIRLLHARYTKDMLDWPISKLSTVTRGSMYLQMEPEISCKEYLRLYEYRKMIDKKSSHASKCRYAFNKAPFTHGTVDSYVISYVGKIDWGALEKYIVSVQTITDGHMIIEVNAACDKVFVNFQQVNKRRKYLDSFLEVLKEEDIPVKVGEFQCKKLPKLKI